MDIELILQGSYCIANVHLRAGEKMKAQSDAMVSMSPSIKLEGKAEGGLGGMFKRVLTGESMFMQTLEAHGQEGEVMLAPSEPGDLAVLDITGDSYILQQGAFLAASASVEFSAISQGIMKGLFSKNGFFLQKVSGKGKLIISSFGGLIKKTLAPGQSLIIDNGHMVAWSNSINYELRKASSGILSSITSGEGLVCDVKGPGDVYIQTRNPECFGQWVRKFIPIK